MNTALGLIGKHLSHSFSKSYFEEKFKNEQLDTYSYDFFEFEHIDEVAHFLVNAPHILGCNVTIPYKEQIIPLLDEVDPLAQEIGAVNVIKQIKPNYWKGFNSDYLGFQNDLLNFLPDILPQRALVLGTGGASKAVKLALQKLNIVVKLVSRSSNKADYTYEAVGKEILKKHHLIVNTTPLGMFPKIDTCPVLPYEYLSEQHYLYDLVYNPEETMFMKKGKAYNAQAVSGLGMLHGQAEAAWDIWIR